MYAGRCVGVCRRHAKCGHGEYAGSPALDASDGLYGGSREAHAIIAPS